MYHVREQSPGEELTDTDTAETRMKGTKDANITRLEELSAGWLCGEKRD